MLSKEKYLEYYKRHQNMWNWFIENPLSLKIPYCKTHPSATQEIYDSHTGHLKFFGCFACLLSEHEVESGDCSGCPMVESCQPMYQKYADAVLKYNTYKIKYYIKKIASIPWLTYEEWVKKYESRNLKSD